jgi:hypothetical protein
MSRSHLEKSHLQESDGPNHHQDPATYRTRLLAGLEFSCGMVFEAAGLA